MQGTPTEFAVLIAVGRVGASINTGPRSWLPRGFGAAKHASIYDEADPKRGRTLQLCNSFTEFIEHRALHHNVHLKTALVLMLKTVVEQSI